MQIVVEGSTQKVPLWTGWPFHGLMGKHHSLNIAHVNARSLLADTRLLDLELLAATNSIDIICITETWLTSSHRSPHLPGFQPIFRRDRDSGRRGGGVAIFVRSGIHVTVKNFAPELETICLEVHLPRRKKLLLVTAYRPPKSDQNVSDFISSFETALDSLQRTAKTIFCLVGDFNAKSRSWWSGQMTNEAGEQLAVLAKAHGLVQLVNGPTRAAGSPHAAQLDLMFISDTDSELVNSCTVLSPLSDHCPTVLQLCVNPHTGWKPETMLQEPRRKLHLADFPGMNNFLGHQTWSSVLEADCTDDALESFTAIIQTAIGKFVPETRSVNYPQNKPWYSSYLCRLRRLRDRLYHRSKRMSPQHTLSAAYRKMRNLYVAELRQAERMYYQHVSESLKLSNVRSNPHQWWKVAKQALGQRKGESMPPLCDNGHLHLQAHDKADCLNEAFAKQCSANPSSATSSPSLDSSNQAFTFGTITASDVEKKMSGLHARKATGLDGIGNCLLKQCSRNLAIPLSHILNLSLNQGIYPVQWKKAVIKPIHKHKGSRANPNNYRPIALLSCLSKVMESFVHKQLLSHCFKVNAIPDEQYGFLPKRSSTWQLLNCLADWETQLDNNGCVHACALDISKAFDRVSHELLLQKLSTIGVRGTALAWFKNYLSGRSICTMVDGVYSSFLPTTSGVPQGSVLGPLLFVIAIKDLPQAVQSTTSIFADDTLIYDTSCTGCVVSSNQCCRIQSDLASLSKWSVENATTFNAAKSAHIVFRRSRQKSIAPVEPSLLFDGDGVPFSSSLKYLGVTFTDSLDWSAHVGDLLQRISFRLYSLKRLAYRCGSNTFVKLLYVTLIRPTLEYAAPVWDSCSKADAAALERAQLAVARAILRFGRRTHSNREVLSSIGWPTLAWRRRRYKLLLFWRLSNGEGPPSLRNHIPPTVSTRADYSFRNGKSVSFPRCSTKWRLKMFLPSTILLWNSLPSSLTSATSSSSFLSKLDVHFSTDMFSLGLP